MMEKKKLVYGVGVNDAGDIVKMMECLDERLPSGRKKKKVVWICPYYNCWASMLMRCYSEKCQSSQPTYKGCSVTKEWLTFSNFRKWMITQEWEAMQLDKDLLKEGNKVYSPEFCVFVHRKVNTFLTSSGATRGDCLLGCHLRKNGKFKAECCDPFKRNSRHISYYNTELEAHYSWKHQKHLYSVELAHSELVTDDRVRQVLLHRYENYNTLEDHLK